MTITPRLVDNPRVWHGAAQAHRSDWIVPIDDGDRREIGRTLAAVRRSGRPLDEVTAADFELPMLSGKLAAVERELATGRGFVLLRGLRIADYSEDDLAFIFWGLCAHLGIGVSQSADGDRIGHVMDRGGSEERYYTRGGELEFHMDPVDVVGLLCLRRALSGGASRIVSSLAVHNAILEERPDLLALLYRGFHNSRRAHGEPSTSWRVPVFAEGGGGHECYLLPVTIRQAVGEGFPLTAPEQEALDYIGKVAARPGMYLDMDFQEGDIQLLNNRAILHARTDYRDDPDPRLKRHLLRLWLMMPRWPVRPDAMRFYSVVDRAGGGVRPRQAAT